MLYLASIECEVSIHVITAECAPRRLTIARVRTGRTFPRHIVLLHTVEEDHYEVVQHKGTTVVDNDQHKDLLLHRLVQLPTTDLPPIADPEVDEPELETDGYEKAPTLIRQGAFSRVYRVAKKDPCAHPRWHALKIVSDVKMVKLEAEALKQLADCRGVPRLWQLVSERALSMEYCVGGSLEKVTEKPLPLAVCIEISRKLLCTISHAHKVGLLHRNIKLANIAAAQAGACVKTPRRRCGAGRLGAGDQRQAGQVWWSCWHPQVPATRGCIKGAAIRCDLRCAGGRVCVGAAATSGEPLVAGELKPDWQEQLETRLSDIPDETIRNLLRAALSPMSKRPTAFKVLLMLPFII